MGVRKERIHKNPLADSLTIYLLGCQPRGTAEDWSLGQSAMQKTCWWTSCENSCFLDGSCKYRSQGACLISPAPLHWTPAWERACRMAHHHSQIGYFRQLGQIFSAYKREGLNFLILGFLLEKRTSCSDIICVHLNLGFYMCSFSIGDTPNAALLSHTSLSSDRAASAAEEMRITALRYSCIQKQLQWASMGFNLV